MFCDKRNSAQADASVEGTCDTCLQVFVMERICSIEISPKG